MLTKEALSKLADMVRKTPFTAEPHVMWAVKHHLAMFLWGLATTDEVLSALVVACGANRDDGITSRLAPEELNLIRGSALVRTSTYREGDHILAKDDSQS